jgi:hypothetical protein
MQKYNYEFVMALLKKDSDFSIVKGQDGILQAAIQPHCITDITDYPPHELLTPVIHELINHGADVNSLDKYQNTATYYACVFGLWNIFSLLLHSGANLHGINSAPASHSGTIHDTRTNVWSKNLNPAYNRGWVCFACGSRTLNLLEATLSVRYNPS